MGLTLPVHLSAIAGGLGGFVISGIHADGYSGRSVVSARDVNGDGKPRYVTAVSRSDVQDGWRDKRKASGVVVDIESDEVICDGLSMPHSPRWHKGKLWVINSGTGYLGYVDPAGGKFEPVAFCPGFARGMAIIGDWAVIGLSHKRENRTFQDLELEENLKAKDAETRCGLLIVNLKTGDAPHWLRFEGVVRELFDVTALPGVIRPMAIGFRNDEIRRYITLPDAAPGR